METNELRLLIVADDPLARAGLAALLGDQSGYTVVGQVAGETDLSQELDIYRPDLVLCDLGWNPTSMEDQLDNLRNLDLPLVVLLLDSSQAADAWAVQPQGLLLRDAGIEKITTALNSAAVGLVTVDPTFIGTLFPQAQGSATPALLEALTAREIEVLQLLAEGLPNKGIARRLDISEHTVKFHVNAIMAKLTAQSRTEAVVRATQLGLIML